MVEMFDYPCSPSDEVLSNIIQQYEDGVFYESLMMNLIRRGYSEKGSAIAIDLKIEDGEINFNSEGKLYLI